MSQVFRYINRDKGVSIKLGNPMTESHGLDIDKKSHLRLLMLTLEWRGTHSRMLLICVQPLEAKNNRLSHKELMTHII
jgi:hypothetical protein